MVIKLSKEELLLVLNEFHVAITSTYQHRLKTELHTGKVTISVKTGKKRVMLIGDVVEVSYESGGFGHPGYIVRKFVPRSTEKLNFIMSRI